MLCYLIKSLFVGIMMVLGSCCPAFAEINQMMTQAGKYHDDLQTPETLQAFKSARDLDTARVKEKIFRVKPVLSQDKSMLARSVLDRKIKIAREREFLRNEMVKGTAAWYARASWHFEKHQTDKSRLEFSQLDQFSPGYRDTRAYLDQMKAEAIVGKKVHFVKPSVVTAAAQPFAHKSSDTAFRRPASHPGGSPAK